MHKTNTRNAPYLCQSCRSFSSKFPTNSHKNIEMVLFLLLLAGSSALIHNLQITNDKRSGFFIENFGFEVGGHLLIRLTNVKVTTHMCSFCCYDSRERRCKICVCFCYCVSRFLLFCLVSLQTSKIIIFFYLCNPYEIIKILIIMKNFVSHCSLQFGCWLGLGFFFFIVVLF